MTSSDYSSESSCEESSSPSSEPVPRKQREKRSKASRKSRKDKKKGSSKKKHGKHAKAKKSKKDKKKKDKKSEEDPSWSKEPTTSWQQEPDKGWHSWQQWRGQSSGSSWNTWKPKTWQKPVAAAKAQIQPFNPALGADHKRKWESTPDAWTDYWQIARQNNEDDEWRVQCPAGARDEGIVPVLHTPDEDAVSKFADETLASFQVPRSMLEAVLRAMMQAGVTCPRVDGVPGIFQLRGEGWGHLVIPLVEQDTEAPLQSPMHREILESETHHFSFAHGTSQYALPMILMERIIRPQNYKKGSIPTVGPFGVASPGHLTMSPDCHTLKTVLKRSRSISKGQQSSTLLCEVRCPEQHVRLEASTGEQLQISCRDAGVAIGPDAAVARSDLTYILGVAITYPF